MPTEHLAYWLEFWIPAGFVVLSCLTRMLVDEESPGIRHLFVGLDLTLFFMCVCLINLVDIAKAPKAFDPRSLMMTAGLVFTGFVLYIFQMVVHRYWEPETRPKWGQIAALCIASNGIGITLIGAFIRLKLKGTI